MNTLEETIIHCASAELATLQNPPQAWDDESRMDYTGAFQAAMAFCKLAHIKDGGLSDVGVTKLIQIESLASEAFVKSGVME